MSMGEPIMCGGCGCTDPQKRCIGCLHDFGTPESAWVQNYNAYESVSVELVELNYVTEVSPSMPPDPRDEEITRLKDELSDITNIAEQFVDLITCSGGRTVNANNSGYRCFLCGADRSAGENCNWKKGDLS